MTGARRPKMYIYWCEEKPPPEPITDLISPFEWLYISIWHGRLSFKEMTRASKLNTDKRTTPHSNLESFLEVKEKNHSQLSVTFKTTMCTPRSLDIGNQSVSHSSLSSRNWFNHGLILHGLDEQLEADDSFFFLFVVSSFSSGWT